MRAIAAIIGLMLAGSALAQQPQQRPAQPAQRPVQPAQPSAQRPAQPAPATPQIPTRVTAATLTTLCGQDRGACLSYILGSTDSFASALAAAGRPQVFCVPRGTTNDQIAQLVVRYLRAHPEEGRSNAGVVVLAGLQSSFPCGY